MGAGHIQARGLRQVIPDYILTGLLVLMFMRYDLVLLAIFFLVKKFRLLLTD